MIVTATVMSVTLSAMNPWSAPVAAVAASLLFAAAAIVPPVEGRRFLLNLNQDDSDNSDAHAVTPASGPGASSGADGWTYGRATNYNTIDVGSCGYGAISSAAITGRDVAAACEKNSDFSGSCGRCYEVQCVDRTVKDRDESGCV